MNQKYLQGISSDMENLDSTVFFEATPENISAFLARHRWAEMSAIGTMKDQSFLTARMGLIRHLSGSRIFGEKDSSDLC